METLSAKERALVKRRKASFQKDWHNFKFTPSDKLKIKKESVSEQACYLVLKALIGCSYSGDFSSVRQSVIAVESGYSQKTVNFCIKALYKCGIIYQKWQYTRLRSGEKHRTTSMYAINIKASHNRVFAKMKELLNKGAKYIEIMKFSAMSQSQNKQERIFEEEKKIKENTEFFVVSSSEGFLTKNEESSFAKAFGNARALATKKINDQIRGGFGLLAT